MASITSMMTGGTSSLSSIYGTRNVLSGLASGMDTETMIENAVSGIKTKIQNLYKKRTKIEWQQEAYRSIIDKAVNFNTKYTSYSSKTNLLSSSFFNNAVNTATKGTYADKITASGKTTSDIKINAVKQMAQAASYTVSGVNTPMTGSNGGIQAGKGFDITGKTPVSTVSGSLSFQYGGTNGKIFDIKFDELENINDVEVLNADGTVKTDATNAEKLAQAIQNKLDDITYSYTKNGVQETTTAGKAIKVEADPIFGSISISDGLGEGNKVNICYVSGDIEDTLGIKKGDTSIRAYQNLTKDVDTKDYLADKELGITFNGTTKKISLADVVKNSTVTYDDPQGTDANQKFAQALQDELDKTFGQGKIKASYEDGKLSFAPQGEGDTMSVGGSVAEAMGFAEGDSNFINAAKKLSDLMGQELFKKENRLMGTFDEGAKPVLSKNGTYYVDSKGNRVDKDGYRITNDDKYIYDFQVNDAHINVTEDTTLESLMNSINSNSSAGMKVSYSKLTNEFKFTATETGANSKIKFDGMAADLFGTVDEKPSVSRDTQLKDIFTTYSNVSDGGNFGDKAFSITAKVDGQDVKLDASVYWGGDGQGTTIADIEKQLNKSITEQLGADSGITAAYNDRTNSFELTDKDGKAVSYTYEKDSMAGRLADSIGRSGSMGDYTAGQDAVLDMEINGRKFENLTRSSNSFDIDGLTVNVKGTFNEDVTRNEKGEMVDSEGKTIEPITFETTTDSDKIIEAIRSFVNDYNEMATEIKNAYSTMPAQQTNGARYEPLTAEQEDGLTESELKSYEEKAKQGILFGDSNLSSMYGRLLNAITPGGTDGQTLREIGITSSYESGMTTLSLDEDKLRSALDSDPDKVKNAFTKTRDSGSSTDGLMKTMQNTLETYVKTTGEPKGVLIQRAGSVKAYTSLNNNSLKTQMDNIDTQIERWQNKMSDQIDRYTSQFSRLEQLIAEMNSQASAMSGLMGGASGY